MINVNSIEKDARTPELVAGLLGIWEASVRASHHFLTEEDIRSLCPQAEEAVRQIGTLWVADDGNVRIGFIGIQSGKIEMLFLHPDYFRKGIGKVLIQKAIAEQDVQYVDVNEQNPSAVKFYERMGFRTFRRDSTDDQGNQVSFFASHLARQFLSSWDVGAFQQDKLVVCSMKRVAVCTPAVAKRPYRCLQGIFVTAGVLSDVTPGNDNAV